MLFDDDDGHIFECLKKKDAAGDTANDVPFGSDTFLGLSDLDPMLRHLIIELMKSHTSSSSVSSVSSVSLLS